MKQQQVPSSTPAQARARKTSKKPRLPRYGIRPIQRPVGWPVLAASAFHGPIGEAVKGVEAHTEADPAAVLTTLLSYAGSLIGKDTFFELSGIEFRANLFMLIIGPTSIGKKGTSLHLAKKLLGTGHEVRELSGLASGESVITELAEPNESSCNVLIIEEEFGRLLESAGRNGSTLSMHVRLLFDGNPLARRTVEGSSRVSDYHAGLLGHITPPELKLRLSQSDQTNGLANRLMMIASYSPRIVIWDDQGRPGSNVGPAVRITNLASIATAGSKRGRIQISDDAWDLLSRIHLNRELSLDNALIARLETQLCRLALVYAVMDGAEEVEVVHVEAARAVVEYAKATTELFFPENQFGVTARQLLMLIREAESDGLTLSQMGKLFSGHLDPAVRNSALKELLDAQLIVEEVVGSDGRPARKYTAAVSPASESEV
jgi:hypothetical protein